jgi:hypothetical protein
MAGRDARARPAWQKFVMSNMVALYFVLDGPPDLGKHLPVKDAGASAATG